MDSKNKENLTLKTIGIMLVAGGSKLVGFLRSAVIAAYFGTTGQTDAFFMAQNIITMLSSASSSGFTSAIVPVLTEEIKNNGKTQADRYASSLTNIVGIVTAALALLAALLAPWIVRIFAPQFAGAQQAATVQMLRVLACMVVMTALVNVFAGFLNTQHRYLPAQMVGFPLSLMMIAFSVFASKSMGVQALVYGLLAGTAGQLLLMALSLKGVFRYTFTFDVHSKALRKTFAMSIPAFISTSLDLINQAVDKALASGLVAGSISALSYATQLTTLVNGLIAVPIATTVFTSLSRHVAHGEKEAVIGLLHKAVSVLMVILIPITVYCVIFPRDIVSIVYARGSFGEAAVTLTSSAFLFYAISLPVWGVRLALTRCFLAFQDSRTPLLVTVIGVALNIALNLVLVRRMEIAGLALATSVSFFVTCILLLLLLRKKAGPLGMLDWAKDIGRILAACLVMAAPVFLVKQVFAGHHAAIRFGVACVAGLTVYVVALWVLRQREIRDTVAKIRAFFEKRKSRGK